MPWGNQSFIASLVLAEHSVTLGNLKVIMFGVLATWCDFGADFTVISPGKLMTIKANIGGAVVEGLKE